MGRVEPGSASASLARNDEVRFGPARCRRSQRHQLVRELVDDAVIEYGPNRTVEDCTKEIFL